MRKGIILIILIVFTGCTGLSKRGKTEEVGERILKAYAETYPEENFYFLYGPDYDGSWGRTTVKYRAILTSTKLEELDYHRGFQINLEDENSPISVYGYKKTLDYLEVFASLKKEAKEIFGEDIIYEIDGTYTNAMHKNILSRKGKNMKRDKKTGLGMIILSVFVENLDKELENIEYWKEGLYQLGERYWEYYNVTGALQIYLYDRELLEEPELLEASLGVTASTDKEIIESLEILREGGQLTREQESYIISKTGYGELFLDYNLIGVYFFTNNFETKEEFLKEKIRVKNRINREEVRK